MSPAHLFRALLLVCCLLAPTLPAGEIRDGWPERLAFQAEVRAMLAAERFDDLVVLARRLRESREKFSEGLEKRYDLMVGLSSPPRGRESDWREWLAKFDRWEQRAPGNLDVQLGRARTMMKFAWEAREGKWGKDAGVDQTAEYKTRLATARVLLERIQQTQPEDADAYLILHELGLSEGWSKAEMHAFFERGIVIHPNYFRLYTAHAVSLMQRWGGDAGEWEAFAAWAADRNKEMGDELYCRIAWAMRELHRPDFFRETRVDWPRMRRGFDLIMARYPGNKWNRNAYAWFACRANDRLAARTQFQQLGEHWHCSLWCGNEFHECQAWSMRDGNDPAPFLKR